MTTGKTFVLGAALLVATSSASAGMLTDPVTSILHTAADGSWSNGNSAVIGPGVEFNKLANANDLLTLDIASASFTLTYVNTATFGVFNEGIDGFEFTDLNQNFTGISLVAGNTFPAGTFAGSSVSGSNIHIFMNEPQIGSGQTFSATWNVAFGSNPTPEPRTFVLLGAGLAAFALRLLFIHKTNLASQQSRT
jgi:hypothetical protein